MGYAKKQLMEQQRQEYFSVTKTLEKMIVDREKIVKGIDKYYEPVPIEQIELDALKRALFVFRKAI